jgi:YfiH family protein
VPGDVLDAGLPGGVRGLFTTRASGVGGGLVPHHRDRQTANRDLLAREAAVSELGWAGQVHGTAVAVVTDHRDSPARRGGIPEVDGLVTTVVDLGLVIVAADCMPVLFADVEAGVIGAAHAGRPGLVAGVLQATVATMIEQGADASRIVAVVGPSICGRCYELPTTMVAGLDERLPGLAASTSWGTPSIDLRAGARVALAEAGVTDVRHVGGCTYEQPERFFSYRRDGTTARHGGLIARDPS